MTHDPTDDVLKELEAALEVTPSPAFADGVRARVRERSVRRRVWPMWTMAGLAAAAAVVLAVLAWPHRESPAAAVAVTASRPSQPAASAPTIAVPSTAGSIAEKGPAGAIVKPRAPGAASHRAAAPEVLVPRDQAVALEALVAGLSNGTIDPQSLATAPADASTPLAPAAQIDIVPIVIPPIEIRTPGTSGGESGGAIR